MHKCSKGIVLPVILIIMLILSVLGMALIGRMNFDSKIEKISEDKMQAHYLARSGILIAKNYLLNNESNLADDQTYYLSGALDSDSPTQNFSVSALYPSIINSTKYIVVKCTVINTVPLKISLNAAGIKNGQKDIINSTLIDNSLADAAAKINAGTPLTSPAINGTTVLDANDPNVNFIDNDGDIKNHINLFTPNKGDSVVYSDKVTVNFNENESVLNTGAMFFDNTGTSLLVSNQAALNLSADFLAYYGDVCIADNNEKNDTHLYLRTLNSTLTEDQLITDGSSTLNYGLVYFANNVYTGKDTDVLVMESNGSDPLNGYYFFPDGVDLPSESDRLIPVTGITAALLGQLNIADTFRATEGVDMTYN